MPSRTKRPELAFEISGAEAGAVTLGETYFDFDRRVDAGQFVDLVIGNGGHGNAEGDESAVRLVIRRRSLGGSVAELWP